MKRYLLIIFFIVSIIACKNDHQDLTSGENKIDFLRAEFEKQTGYDQSQVNLLTPTFRSEVDWAKAIYKGEDTVLVTVRLLDTVIYPINGSEINLKDNVILKAVRNKKLEWSFTTVIFVPTSLTGGYSGLILSRPLSDKAERIRYYNKGSVINSDEVIRIKFANTKGKSQSGSKLRAGCTYAYVNGILNQVTCTPPEKGEREDDPGFGEPGDYFPPGHGGGSGGSTTSPVNKLNKNDPCANKNELNNRKKNSQIKGKNNEIKNLTSQKGLEHGSNAYVNLNNGVVTGFTDVKEGYKTGSGQEVPSVQSWRWLPNNQVEVTADYNHTHPFESGPSSIDVFEGIYPYIATSNSNMDALSPAQKEVYLSYHSINVMTTNHDYAITITDPVKWVSRYPIQVADFEKFQSMFKQYEKSGYIGHTAQELALLELYGDMIQLYRSEVGMNNFEPVISKIDPNTFKKFISKINCN